MSRVFERKKGEWWIDFKDAQGIRHRKKVAPNKRIAKEVLDGILGNVARRQYLGVIEESAISFSDYAEEWKRRVEPTLKPRTRERWFRIVDQHLKPAFPGALRSITQATIEGYIAKRLEATRAVPKPVAARERKKGAAKAVIELKRTNPATVNREVGVLKHMLRRAVDWEYLRDNSAGKVKALRESPGRTRFLSPDEIAKLLEACGASRSPYLRPFVLVALNTGMRRNEILGVTSRSIDWQNRIVTLLVTKNGQSRHVHLNGPAFESLRSLAAKGETDTAVSHRLFPFKDEHSLGRAFRRAAKKAGIDDFRLHDLRHTFASYQAMAGIQSRGLQALLGHKDGRMTMRYSHIADNYLRSAVERVELGTTSSTEATPPVANGKENGTNLAPALAVSADTVAN